MTEKTKHVLIVEDAISIAEILIDYLKQAGFEVSHLSSGLDVIHFLKTRQPDLLLLDIMLPGKDGIEICREIRTFSNVPIIMVTARVDEVDRLIGLEIGADDYICKPFSPREVVARVKAYFRRAGVAASTTAGGRSSIFNIDEQQLRAYINGQLLDLTPTEFRLLKLFVQNPGRVYSRSQLLTLCYQQEQHIFDRTIDSHIKNLRKKLDKMLPGTEVIHAVYGVGYRFEYDAPAVV